MTKQITPEAIDALLPQTQCGLCGHGGCMPYAEAIIFEHAPINLCPPGGVQTLKALGELLAQDPIPYIAEMEKNAKPLSIAQIRETECIGCTKCIAACPVDAIIGGAKQMHTILTSICTGCELCIPPCSVDCIDMKMPNEINMTLETEITAAKQEQSRQRFNVREKRLLKIKQQEQYKQKHSSNLTKKNYIANAIARRKEKS